MTEFVIAYWWVIPVIVGLIICLVIFGFDFVVFILEIFLSVITAGKFEGFGSGESGGGGSDDAF